jgi:hypothetical protein
MVEVCWIDGDGATEYFMGVIEREADLTPSIGLGKA